MIFKIVDDSVDKRRKIRRVCNTKIDIFVFLFFIWVLFPCRAPFFYLDLSTIIPLLGKLRVLGPSCGGCLHGLGRQCPPFQNEIWVCARWFLLGGLRLPMVSRIGYRVYGYLLYQCTSIAVPYSLRLQITGPPRGTNSFSYLQMVIRRLP